MSREEYDSEVLRVDVPGTNLFFNIDRNPSKCVVCSGGRLHIEFEGVGKVCLRHAVDMFVDDYESSIDYTQYDDFR